MLAKTSPGFCWAMITMIEDPCCLFFPGRQGLVAWARTLGTSWEGWRWEGTRLRVSPMPVVNTPLELVSPPEIFFFVMNPTVNLQHCRDYLTISWGSWWWRWLWCGFRRFGWRNDRCITGSATRSGSWSSLERQKFRFKNTLQNVCNDGNEIWLNKRFTLEFLVRGEDTIFKMDCNSCTVATHHEVLPCMRFKWHHLEGCFIIGVFQRQPI